MSTYFVPGSGDITQAIGPSQRLQLLDVSRNDQNFSRSSNYSPYQTFGARISDALRSAHGDTGRQTFMRKADAS